MPDNKTPSTPRQYAPPNVDGIPKVLQLSVRFCVWKTEERDGKCTKVPFNPRTGGRAMTNVPSTFSDFDTALMTYKASQDKLEPYLGLGINISDAIVVIDIDHCIAADGSISDFAQDVLDIIGEAYVEFSPSGTGLHIFGRAPGLAFDKTRYFIKKSELGLEVYVAGATNRFMTVTGIPYLLPNSATDTAQITTLPDISNSLQELLDEYMLRPPQCECEAPLLFGIMMVMDDFDGLLHGEDDYYDDDDEAFDGSDCANCPDRFDCKAFDDD